MRAARTITMKKSLLILFLLSLPFFLTAQSDDDLFGGSDDALFSSDDDLFGDDSISEVSDVAAKRPEQRCYL